MIRAYVAMLPRIEAQERLAQINAIALASGNLEPADRRRTLDDLVRKAEGGTRRARKAAPGDLKGMGIGVRIVPAKSVEADLKTSSEASETGLIDG
jgi:hypothetical protein